MGESDYEPLAEIALAAAENQLGPGPEAAAPESGTSGALPPVQTKLEINQTGDVFEQEANRVAEQVMGISVPATASAGLSRTVGAVSPDSLSSQNGHATSMASSSHQWGPAFMEPTSIANLLMRQPATLGAQPGTSTPTTVIDQARLSGFVRCQRAYERLVGIGPPPPPGRPDMAQEWQRRARTLARTIFNEDLNMSQVTDIVGAMRNWLTPGLDVVRASATDPECRTRAGYVVNFSPPVHLCPTFFKSSAEEQIRTMIHETAHLAGIGEAAGESYCGEYDCETSCGGFNVADSWAHFVHCLSGQTPDVPLTITGKVP